MKSRKILKIALVGATCTGKTTILNALKEKFVHQNDIKFIDEGARAFYEMHPRIKDRGSWRTQAKIRDWVVEDEVRIESQEPKVIICDRSVLDSVIYLNAYQNYDNANKMLNSIRQHLSSYNEYVMLDPKDVSYKKDSIRTESPEFRMKVHELFLDYFKENNIRYTLLSGTLDQKINYLTKIINSSFNT